MAEKPLKDLRILVMEDEFLIAMDVEQLCQDHGAEEVIILRTLKELGDQPVGDRGINVAVVDVMLAGESTVEFAKTLQDNNVPFVFATGYAENENLFEAFPGIRVVGKPYAGPTLITAIVEAVNQGQGQPVSGGV
ncbi:response regulator [Aliihoeflea sp. 2WW]|uniref:response regulator n=1 Tax=Aliihoeflea sp. 2WW TaxID=1381123 RepID=UPI0004AF6A0E|nr:response regulator [Aliihoeflea sp. 2WW]